MKGSGNDSFVHVMFYGCWMLESLPDSGLASGQALGELRQRLEAAAFLLLRRKHRVRTEIRKDVGKLGQQLHQLSGGWSQRVRNLVRSMCGEEGT
jgi:hypothetical protein